VRGLATGDVRRADLKVLIRRTGAGRAFLVSEANKARDARPAPVTDYSMNAATGDHAPAIDRVVATAAPSRIVTASGAGGFDWGDAAIGGGGTLGLALLLAGGGVAVTRRRAGRCAPRAAMS
jgi:hypothetical protein